MSGIMSNINLRRFIQDHYKSGVTARDVTREAITNAIQANATEITVSLNFSNSQGSLVSGEARRVLEKISITDNGDGFTDENLQYFYEVCTAHKEKIGGKGVGRLSYLKFANDVNIQCQLLDQFIEFTYSPEFELKDVTRDKKSGSIFTKISLSNLSVNTNTYVSTFVNSICEDLRLLLFLKKQKQESIKINFLHDSDQPFDAAFTFNSNDITAIAQKEFKFGNQDFMCHLFKDEPPKKGIFAMLCADDLRIEELSISKRFDKARYSIFISSPYFNSRSNMERQRLEIPQEENTNDLFTPISRSTLIPKIRSECMALVTQHAEAEIIDFKKSNLEKLRTFYPYITSASLIGNAQLLDSDQVIKQYRENQAKNEDDLVEALSSGKSPSIGDITHLASDDLARYIVHRALVIESLSNIPKDAIENEVHKAFLPKGKNGKNIYDNNIWLIDDKFLAYSSIFSDEYLKSIIEELNSNLEATENRRPDIAAFYTKNDLNNPNKLVIVEFKKPSAGIWENSKALTQCRVYANNIVDKVTTVMEVFTFAIVEINDEFYRELKQTNYIDVFSPAERILYQSFKIGIASNVVLHQYVMPPSALLKDAKARNKVFEDILKLEN